MFDDVTIRATDPEASERLYAVLAALGVQQTSSDERCAEWDAFSLAAASADQPATRRLHVAFVPSRARTWTTSGGRAAEPATARRRSRPEAAVPGRRLRRLPPRPDGNSVEVVSHNRG